MDLRGLVDIAALRPGDLMLQPLQPFPPFEEFPALGEALNVMIERMNALILRGGVGVRVKDTSAGLMIETELMEPAEATESEVSAFAIGEVRGDYLVCNEMTWADDGTHTQSPDATNVAKPHYLRISNLGTYQNVSSNQRTVPIAGNPATPGVVESLKPAYLVGDIIIAAKLDSKTPLKVGETVLEWEDVNADARNWFPGYQVVNVCINGQARRMIVAGSAPFV
jgi:hypothetical protein